MMFALGGCGSGKSYWLQQQVAMAMRSPAWAGARFVVLDVAGAESGAPGQWPGEPSHGKPKLTIKRVRDAEGARVALEEGFRYTIVRPGPSQMSAAPAPPWWHVAGELGSLVQQLRRIVLVLPEAHESCAEGYPLPASIRSLAHAHRHAEAEVWGDTQQTQYVKKELLTSATVVCLFAGAPRDYVTWRELWDKGGNDLMPKLQRLSSVVGVDASGRPTTPGWHVRMLPNAGAAGAYLVDPRGIVR